MSYMHRCALAHSLCVATRTLYCVHVNLPSLWVADLGTRECLASSLSCDFNMIKSNPHDYVSRWLLISPPIGRMQKWDRLHVR